MYNFQRSDRGTSASTRECGGNRHDNFEIVIMLYTSSRRNDLWSRVFLLPLCLKKKKKEQRGEVKCACGTNMKEFLSLFIKFEAESRPPSSLQMHETRPYLNRLPFYNFFHSPFFLPSFPFSTFKSSYLFPFFIFSPVGKNFSSDSCLAPFCENGNKFGQVCLQVSLWRHDEREDI